jgi:hypothetical protein
MILSVATTAYAEELTVEPTDLDFQEYLRTQLQERLSINEAARMQKLDRFSMRNPEQVCFNDIDSH